MVPIDKELHADDVINFMNVSESNVVIGSQKNLKQINDKKDKLQNEDTIFISFEDSTKEFLSLKHEIKNEGELLLEKGNDKFVK